MALKPIEIAILRHVEQQGCDLRKVSDQWRQRLIDLGMREPPLVDVLADQVFITEHGREAIS